MAEHRLRIPDRDVQPLQWLGSSPEPEFQALVAAMDNDARTVKELVDSSAEALQASGAPPGAFVDMLISMNAFRLAHSLSIEQFSSRASQSTTLELPPDDRASLKTRLDRLLRSQSILLVSKAADLLSEHERSFHTCRIFSEMRPVFDEESLQEPTAFVVSHSLKIDFTEEGNYDAIYLALDDSDLAMLAKAVERARKKSDALTQWITNTGVQVANAEPTVDNGD